MAVIKEGAKAPAFKGADQHGKTVSIADFKGQKVVLYFYPKDDTPGCTAQACNLRDNYKKLIKKGIAILGVSVDSVASHVKFIDKYDLLEFGFSNDTLRRLYYREKKKGKIAARFQAKKSTTTMNFVQA